MLVAVIIKFDIAVDFRLPVNAKVNFFPAPVASRPVRAHFNRRPGSRWDAVFHLLWRVGIAHVGRKDDLDIRTFSLANFQTEQRVAWDAGARTSSSTPVWRGHVIGLDHHVVVERA